jgi:hypothetical protein
MTEEQILQKLGFSGWQVVSRSSAGDEYIPDPIDQYADKVPNPQSGEKWIITDGKGGRQTITVKQALGKGGQPWAGHYEVSEAPSATAPRDPANTQPAKGTRRIVQSGGQWVQEIAVDDKGTWSVETGPDGKPLSVPVEKSASADATPSTKAINGRTFQFNPQTNTWDEARGLPAEQKDRKTQVLGTGPNDQWRLVVDTETGEVVSKDQNPNYRAPGADLTPGQRAVDVATAGTAGGIAEANLRKAQADADTAALNLQNAQTVARQKPTDAQAQQAIATAQRQLDLANQQLEQSIAQAGTLNPIAVDQAKATLARSKQLIEKDQLGDLYGRQEQIRQIKALVQSGEMSPAEADMAVSALNRGTTVFDAQKQMQADRSVSRGQDVSNRNQLAGTFGSMATSSFGQLADMNKYATPGSSAGADAFVAMLNMAQSRLKDYAMPPAQETNYLGPIGQMASPVSGMVNAAQQQLAAAPVVQPVPQPMPVSAAASSPAQPITINIGGPPQAAMASGAGSRGMGGEAAGGPPLREPMPSGGGDMLASAASRGTPVRSADEIYRAYGVI